MVKFLLKEGVTKSRKAEKAKPHLLGWIVAGGKTWNLIICQIMLLAQLMILHLLGMPFPVKALILLLLQIGTAMIRAWVPWVKNLFLS
jgi:hypothetical protein